MGLKVLTAHDPTTALAIIRMRPLHVICLDVQMPAASDGLKLCETIAANASLSELPLVILTDQADVETIIRCAAMGAYTSKNAPRCGIVLNRCSRNFSTSPRCLPLTRMSERRCA